ncbi:MAG: ABC transporter ATP-binding protein, partial [Sulfitobacter litoralis]|uniref:ATP-binding cassette domain-containing protein n=1 Tax=Sulfitobacter litoralis TaxID=335975 RepID=UPI001B711EFD
YDDLTVFENLNLYADLRSVTEPQRAATFERLLEFTGLRPFTKRLAGALSGGMKQKLGIACALIETPRLLLLDEPSVGVDPLSRRELWQMVYELVDQGIGVIWSTAYLDEAERCASVMLLNEGQLIYDGPPDELTNRVRGRAFLLSNIEGDRRLVLARSLEKTAILDGVIQGRNIRIVTAKGALPPLPSDLLAGEDAIMASTPPRFEDAFMDLMGGGQKRPSPFLQLQSTNTHQNEIAVEAMGLTRRFGDFTATDNISFEVKRGEIYGLIGPNGAGKSTTFKMLCGLLRPSEGLARVAGMDLQKAPSKARARLGYMAQKFSLYGDLSVSQNMDFFAGIYGLTGKKRREAIETLVSTFGLASYLETNAIMLPLGYKQRLALACAVLHEPDVLFLDEPTSGVDPLTRREFWSHINAMVGNGVTVVVTTHFLEEAEYCDRMALIYRGRIIAAGAPDKLKASARSEDIPEPTLEDAFIALVENEDRQRERT